MRRGCIKAGVNETFKTNWLRILLVFEFPRNGQRFETNYSLMMVYSPVAQDVEAKAGLRGGG
jgi:hypothetical protein